MRKLSLALGLLLLPVALWAQKKTDSVQINVRHLTLIGTPQISPAEQQQIAAEINRLNPPTTLESVAEMGERLRYALQERGFLKALPGDPDVTIVNRSQSEEIIDATYHVDLGQQYRLKEITFSNVDPKKGFAFGTGELRQAFPIKDGEIFDTGKIRIGLEKLRELYANNGYINFTPVPNTDAGDAAGTISLRIDMDEGSIFRVGKLLLDGVEPAPGVGAKLLEAWKPYEGQVCTGQLLDNYMRETAKDFPGNYGRRLFQMHEDAEHHVVNYRLELDDPASADGRALNR